MSLNIIQTWVILDALKHLVETPSSEDFFFFRWDLLRPKKPGLGAVEVQKDTRPIWYPG